MEEVVPGLFLSILVSPLRHTFESAPARTSPSLIESNPEVRCARKDSPTSEKRLLLARMMFMETCHQERSVWAR